MTVIYSCIFAGTLFLSAALLFLVQPLQSKQLLPHLGGTPAVWTTTLVFFQFVLLLGYLYAHRLGKLTTRWQLVVHSFVCLVASALLILGGRLVPAPNLVTYGYQFPAISVLMALIVTVLGPAFLLSTTSPLLQKWFAALSKANPYPLYAASNAGSLGGLLAYPLVCERIWTISEQRWYWIAGFGALVVAIIVCAILLGRFAVRKDSIMPESRTQYDRLTRFRWLLLAALPSSFLVSVTTHLTTDVAPVPLLWVIPLSIYLLTYIVTFAYWPGSARVLLGRLTPMLLAILTVTLASGATEPITIVAVIHLVTLASVALLCHGELAFSRPHDSGLTAFYLMLALGGVLGGAASALLAPVIFSSIGLAEYPLAIIAVALVRPTPSGLSTLKLARFEGLYLLGFLLLMGAMWFVAQFTLTFSESLNSNEILPARLLRTGLLYGVPAIVAFALVRNPVRFAICLATIFIAGHYDESLHGNQLFVSRNYFGTLRVTVSPDGRFTRLVHGTTLHGQERRHFDRLPEPLMYYHRTGPIGRLLTKLPAERRTKVAAIGLGVGALAAYAMPGEQWDFFEIDPGVIFIAQDSGHFHFLETTRGHVQIKLGDARKQLELNSEQRYDLIILDAFSSDSIPMHLLTKEAFQLYVQRLTPNGILAFHLSNRYLDLPPLVTRLAREQSPAYQCRLDVDFPTEREHEEGKFPSIWVCAFRNVADLGDVAKDVRWHRLEPRPGPIWTDDYSSILGVWKKDD